MSLADARARAEAHSPFLRGLMRREPELLHEMAGEGYDAALKTSLARLDPERAAPSIREARGGVALTVALADLSGAWRLEQVTGALTHFADSALDFAIRTAFAEREVEATGLTALALGKMGSFELNYSSDIDLIFLHDPETLPHRDSEDPTEAAVRIVRRVAALLAERTSDGYALRVDLRLRPDPDSTPSSLPLGAALAYYQSQALAWERSAFIRARASAGDVALGQRFLKEIEPFIWRRSLDYSALAEIREVSHQIRDHFAEGQKLGPGFDLKRGRGGIREVEFYAQVHQMIFGGRDTSLRAGATMDALAALADAGRIERSDAQMLAEAYRHYRTLEHRIQMVGDQQTHSVPKLAPERAQVAGLAGAESWKALEADLAPRLKAVGRLYDRLLETGDGERGARIPMNADDARGWAAKAKVKDPQLLATLIEGWRSGRPRSLRAPEALQAFETVIPSLVQQVAGGRTGREALLRLDQMIQALPSGVQFWRLLAAHPALQKVVANLLTATPLLADALAKRPSLIDILLEPAPALPDAAAALAELRAAARGLEGEALLDRVRLWTAERRFQLGVQLLEGRVAPAIAARELAYMAEAAVALLADSVAADFRAKHGEIPGGRLLPLALGRFGGGELTTQSDLDLILLFTGSFETQSTGKPPLSASAWFNRLGPRLLGALTVPTAAGPLYEVDTRLRPSGNDGLLVVSLDSFQRYQQAEAGLWEHMALTRARPVACTPDDAAAAQAVIDDIVAAPRDPTFVRREAQDMRRHIARHKAAAGPFDVKLMKGGLVDIEFIVQARALMAGRPIPPRLDAAIAELAPELADAARLMMDMLVMLRLVQPHDASAAPDAAAGAVIARACGKPGFAALKAELAAARKTVAESWATTFHPKNGE
ncbi:bifunctional [glutamine synthetase] adenylyltransferase/[glutamine synthetase]-adenylyl-L-tyrosine phosphorylase [Sandaracinobacter sp. RS1-74]|uniref:bifunctional [glutamine synthetase] adenylyltransferase/[glutamine synthetase]-adenylyl-L-tyrosine phosphorylase n=1 Tax=Sandaracinobacteroides sayramensis TaxID=2913411 RepID=UPI001EDA85E4|nr:bifunctional [glutamine synthetase] adenylyltransferase/[glutamine synthetase]-adenylyl-L-tyrosine phosphorylase [Sandaracinobacteroides sayramensis]MCG2842352.1 bifunctional [glutamine synthetase] adenylyltransferase/[glutamine synthetase]-adenylyl-L-tyrosine phosphorylase [Sandaracinobacteroides sayramensis]